MVREATSISLLYGSVSYCLRCTLSVSNPAPGLGIADFIGFLEIQLVVFFFKYHHINCDLYITLGNPISVMTPKVMNIIVKMDVYHIKR